MSYRSKIVEPIRLPDREARQTALREAGHNLFNLDSADVYIDLLTDSGTGAMSEAQWAALLRGDEAYAGSESFASLRAAVDAVMGFDRIVPVHQGRGAENVLYGSLVENGDVVPNNTHFDTTRGHIANNGGRPIDCPVQAAADPDSNAPFKGNMDVAEARSVADEIGPENIPVVVITITNNSMAGQPVSVENTRDVRELADELDATFVIDACRFAENAYFVKQREAEFADRSIPEIAREQLGYADALVMSGKKDGLVNAGGFVAVSSGRPELFEHCKQRAIMYEGFPTYGGMAGRDMAAFAVGLREAVEEGYLSARIGQVRRLGERLEEAGTPVYKPFGGHAVYLDAGRAVPQLPDDQFPGQALACALYREGAVRGVELGSFAFPGADRPEFVRLALPRRAYHDEHLTHVVETAADVMARADELPGYEIVDSAPVPELRHFSARLTPVEPQPTPRSA